VKRRILVFFVVAALILSIMPAIHILSAQDRKAIRWTDRGFLYNVDALSAVVSRLLLPLGISTDPEQAIIGRKEWLYLGDQHQLTLSTDRRPQTAEDVEIARRIAEATAAWDAYLAARGVRLFRIMVAPNKGSVYPEYMPDWARPASPNGTDALFATAGLTRHIDLRPALIAERAKQPVPLYYKTDTHWNFLGAGLAFRAFAREVAPAAPELRWPAEDTYAISRVDRRIGGDLARFLRIPDHFDDEEPVPNSLSLPVQTTQYDYGSGQVVHKGGNPPVDSPGRPLLVRSEGALNRKKVLWLRDSFGQMMAPLMAATFSDVIQLHWNEALKPDMQLARLVEEWKPDYVFFTVIERASRDPKFALLPPSTAATAAAAPSPAATTAAPPAPAPSQATAPASAAAVEGIALDRPVVAKAFATQHLVADGRENGYRVTGVDPYIDFGFPVPVDPARTPYLRLAIDCADGNRTVPVQIFWLTEGVDYYSEQNSVRLVFETGSRVFDLRTMSGIPRGAAIRRLRLDTDAGSACTQRRMQAPEAGAGR
jgi:alginate O-acetyltransferase complex protein AlgJ